MYINTYKHSKEDVACALCKYYQVKGKGCHFERCPYFFERMEGGGAGYREAVLSIAAPYPALLSPLRQKLLVRVNSLVHRFHGCMIDPEHKCRMDTLCTRVGYGKNDCTNSFYAIVYLCTANPELLQRTEACFYSNYIALPLAKIKGISELDYVLHQAAKLLCQGDDLLSMEELSDPLMVSDLAFRLVMNATLIRTYGLNALKITER